MIGGFLLAGVAVHLIMQERQAGRDRYWRQLPEIPSKYGNHTPEGLIGEVMLSICEAPFPQAGVNLGQENTADHGDFVHNQYLQIL